MNLLSDTINRRFIESFDLSDWEIETDSGWQDVTQIHKTVEYEEWELKTESGFSLIAADTHIIFDDRLNEIFVKDLIPNQTRIMTKTGPNLVVSLKNLKQSSHMYDITVDSPDHRYYTNGILSHNSTVVAAYFAWYMLFNENKTGAILGNKKSVAVEIFNRVQFIIENLPPWLQQGITEWNKTSFKLENGCRCFAAASSPSAVRGFSVSIILLDEFGFLSPNLADDFIASVFPTLSSSESSKLIIVSTPNGLNHYHKLWVEAEQGLNDFVPISGHWTEHPGRNAEWAEAQRKKLGDVRYMQEIECEFHGSSYTLVDGRKLATLPIVNPIYEKDELEVFKAPESGHVYAMTVDVSRGRHLDSSAFTVYDVTSMPYEVVATFKDNSISTMEYPHLIYNTARQYNDAYVLIELNDLGEEVANTIWYEYAYENLYFTNKDELVEGNGRPGVVSTKRVKALGCSVLKELIEKDQLIINSHRIIEELGVFVLKGKSYAADDTAINDDLCTTLWLFAWLTKQETFQQATNINLREILAEKKNAQIDANMTPYGFYDNGINTSQEKRAEDNLKLPDKESPYYLTPDQIELLSW